MNDYDFQNLSPFEFEILVHDILEKHLKLPLERFATGKDSGIDIRYSRGLKQNIIIQCKHYDNFNNLYASLKKEVAKVKKLKPRRYLVVTTLGLSPDQKEKILILFKPFIKESADIIGRQGLNDLIKKNPEVEKNHIKLWLTSTTVLENILQTNLNQGINNRSRFEKEEIKKSIKVYVQNRSYNDALEKLKENHFVIISGIPGIGKTTLAKILTYYFLAHGFESFYYLSEDISEADNVYDDKTNQVFLFDDFLGRNFLDNNLSKNEDKRIIQFLLRVKQSKNKYVILTTREYILQQALIKHESLDKTVIDPAKCIVDLSKYTRNIKAIILFNHLYFANLPSGYINSLAIEKMYLGIIDHKNYSPRIIETILNKGGWKKILPKDFGQTFKDYLDKPLLLWNHAFSEINGLSRIILCILASVEPPILIEDLKKATIEFCTNSGLDYNAPFNHLDFTNSLKELEGTFITLIRDDCDNTAADFQNPSVRDFLIDLIKKDQKLIDDIIKNALFINQLFGIFSYYSSPFDDRKINTSDLTQKKLTIKLKSDFNDIRKSTIRKVIQFNGNKYHWSRHKTNTLDKIVNICLAIYLDENPEIKEIVLSNFQFILPDQPDDQFDFYVALEELWPHLRLTSLDIRNFIKDSISKLSTIENLEMFQKIRKLFLSDYQSVLMKNKLIFKDQLKKIVDSDVEYLDDLSLGELAKNLTQIEKEFNIDLSDEKDIISEAIASNAENTEGWEPDALDSKNENQEISNSEIIGMFESFLSN